MASQEIWITGAGIISALGEGLETHLGAIEKKECGLKAHNFFEGNIPDPCIAGKIPDTVIAETVDQTAAMRANIIAEKAFLQTLAQSEKSIIDKTELVVGTTLGNIHGGSLYYKALMKNECADIGLVKHVMPDAVANYLSQRYQMRSKHLTISSACASGLTAICTALKRITRGHCCSAFACGVDALSPFVIAGFNSLRLLSKKNCRPFGVSRDGLNPGEGAGCILLENAEQASIQNHLPLAKITGFGTALEAYHYTKSHPEGKGIALAIRKALAQAGIKPDDIDHIHAHGTATVINDFSEYNGYMTIFGDNLSNIPVCSTKSMTGHTFGAAGAISVIMAILSIKNGIIPATLCDDEIDPLFKNLYLLKNPLRKAVKRVLCVTLGFGGEVAALVVEAI